jgi:hypothetical protein
MVVGVIKMLTSFGGGKMLFEGICENVVTYHYWWSYNLLADFRGPVRRPQSDTWTALLPLHGPDDYA